MLPIIAAVGLNLPAWKAIFVPTPEGIKSEGINNTPGESRWLAGGTGGRRRIPFGDDGRTTDLQACSRYILDPSTAYMLVEPFMASAEFRASASTG